MTPTFPIPIEGFLDLTAFLLQLLPIYFQLRHYSSTRYRASLLWMLFFIAMGGVYAFAAVGQFLLSPLWFTISILCIIPMSISINLVIDAHERDTVEPVRLAVLAFFAAIFIWTSTLPDATGNIVNLFGETVLGWGGSFQVVGSILMIFAALAFTWHVLKVKRQVRNSSKLKHPAFWLLVADLCYWIAVGLAGAAVAGYQLFITMAALITARTYSREPKLYFLLSFKALRLTVIQNETGIPLFTHTWKTGTDMADETLYAGMLQGIGMLLKETINRGTLKEIRLGNGVLLLRSSEKMHVTCALVATRSSKTLENALALFLQQFTAQFAGALKRPEETSQFQAASPLVEACFPFIPEFDI